MLQQFNDTGQLSFPIKQHQQNIVSSIQSVLESKNNQAQLKQQVYLEPKNSDVVNNNNNNNNRVEILNEETMEASTKDIGGYDMKPQSNRYFEFWCYEKNYKAKRKLDSHTPMSHSSQDGYILQIPDIQEVRATSFRKLVKDFEQGHLYNLSECIVDLYNEGNQLKLYLFQELDCPKNERALWNFEFQNEISKVYCATLSEFMQKEQKFCVYMSLRQHRSDYKANNKKFAANIHFQTNICTTFEKAIRVHALFVQNLQAKFHRNPNAVPNESGEYEPGQTPWERIVDPLVLQGNKLNLRLNYTNKIIKCTECNGKKGDIACKWCSDKGKIEAREFYRVVKVFDRNGNEDLHEWNRIRSDIVRELMATSIRPYETQVPNPFFTIPENCPGELNYSLKKDLSGEMNWSKKSDGKILNPEFPTRGKWKDRAQPLDHNSVRAQACLRAIRKCHVLFAQVILGKCEQAFDNQGRLQIYVNVRGNGCNACLNRASRNGTVYGQYHSSSNSTWFQFYNNSLTQLCRAGTKTQNRLNGPCKTWKGKTFALDYEEIKEIFPDSRYLDSAVPSTATTTASKTAIYSAKHANPFETVTAVPATVIKEKTHRSSKKRDVAVIIPDIDAENDNNNDENKELTLEQTVTTNSIFEEWNKNTELVNEKLKLNKSSKPRHKQSSTSTTNKHGSNNNKRARTNFAPINTLKPIEE